MADDPEELRARLLARESKIPTSVLGRFGRTAWSALRGRRWLRDGGGDAAMVTELVASLGQLKGVAMKVGQIMSYIDVALPDDVRAALAALQTSSPAMPFARVREVIAADLAAPRAAELLAGLEEQPVAAASIGQVHRGTLPGGERVAVKVRYPEIERAIAGDFGPASMGSRLASLIYPGARVDAFVREARERFLAECDYQHEARCQQRFGAIYAGHATLTVPDVHEAFSGPRVLTTSWADGVGLDRWLASDPPSADRDRVGQALFEFYVGTLYRHALYNGDPHPGNYVFLPDGRVAMLDHGCTREFDRAFVGRLARLTRAVQEDVRAGLERALVDFGIVRAGQRYDFATARGLVRSFYGPMLRDEVLAVAPGEALTFGGIMTGKRELMKLSLPGELLFLLRIRFGLMSILARIGARANWHRLERGYSAEV